LFGAAIGAALAAINLLKVRIKEGCLTVLGFQLRILPIACDRKCNTFIND